MEIQIYKTMKIFIEIRIYWITEIYTKTLNFGNCKLNYEYMKNLPSVICKSLKLAIQI